MEQNVELSEEAMSRLVGHVLRIDHSFKLPKTFVTEARTMASAVMSCLNEEGLITGWYGTETSSLEEVRPVFAGYQQRCERIQGQVWY